MRSPSTQAAVKPIHIGSRVRIAGEAALLAALHRLTELRPEPGQMLCAGQDASVTDYRRSPKDDRSLYALKGAPGLWPEEWLDPI
jgi:hypothetical protein